MPSTRLLSLVAPAADKGLARMFPKYQQSLVWLAELDRLRLVFLVRMGEFLFLYLFSTLHCLFPRQACTEREVCLLWSAIGLAALLAGLHGR